MAQDFLGIPLLSSSEMKEIVDEIKEKARKCKDKSILSYCCLCILLLSKVFSICIVSVFRYHHLIYLCLYFIGSLPKYQLHTSNERTNSFDVVWCIEKTENCRPRPSKVVKRTCPARPFSFKDRCFEKEEIRTRNNLP